MTNNVLRIAEYVTRKEWASFLNVQHRLWTSLTIGFNLKRYPTALLQTRFEEE